MADIELSSAQEILDDYVALGDEARTAVAALNDARANQADRCDPDKHSQVLVIGSSDNIACANAIADAVEKAASRAARFFGAEGEDPEASDEAQSVDDIDSLLAAVGALEAGAIEFVAENFMDFQAAASAALGLFDEAVAFAESITAHWQDEPCFRSANSAQAQAAKILEQSAPRTSVTFVHLSCVEADIQDGLID